MSEPILIGVILIAAIVAGYVGGLMSHRTTSAMAGGNSPVFTDAVRAKRYELLGAAGEIRGTFETSTNGEPYLEMYDQAGVPRVTLTVADSAGPFLMLFDEAGRKRGQFWLMHGAPQISLFDDAGAICADLSLSVLGEPEILFNYAGESQIHFHLSSNGPWLTSKDAAGKMQVIYTGNNATDSNI